VAAPTRGALGWVIVLALLLGLVYLPLLLWLGKAGFVVSQLSTGGVLVLFALWICLQDIIHQHPFAPNTSDYGFGLLGVAFVLMAAALYATWLALPFVLVSFCCSFAAVISFLFGRESAKRMAPALGMIFVFGMLAALFPQLDWPLRAVAGRYAASLINTLGIPVQLALDLGHAPKLLLIVSERVFIVATECNGFGLLASSLLLSVFLAFHYRMAWWNRLGLIVLALPIAIGCNFLRIVSIALIAPRIPLPYMWIHETLGLIFYYSGLGLIWVATHRYRVPPPPAKT
jgi:exosortase